LGAGNASGDNTTDWAAWAEYWRDVRVRIDESPEHRIRLTIDQIRAKSGCHDPNIERLWFWGLILARAETASAPFVEHLLWCEPHVVGDRVIAVTVTTMK
jgi:hypothetical protein